MNCNNTSYSETKSSYKSLLPSIDNFDTNAKCDSEIKLIKNIKNYIESPDFPINIKEHDFKDSLTEKIGVIFTIHIKKNLFHKIKIILNYKI